MKLIEHAVRQINRKSVSEKEGQIVNQAFRLPTGSVTNTNTIDMADSKKCC